MSEFKEFSVAVANKEQFEAVRDVLEGMGYTAYVSRNFKESLTQLVALESGEYLRSNIPSNYNVTYNQFMQEYGKKEASVALYTWKESNYACGEQDYFLFKPTGEYLSRTTSSLHAKQIVNELNKLLTKE